MGFCAIDEIGKIINKAKTKRKFFIVSSYKKGPNDCQGFD
jgi:hypothetical protein